MLVVASVTSIKKSLNTFPIIHNLIRKFWNILVRWVTVGQQVSHIISHSTVARLPCSLIFWLPSPQLPGGMGGITPTDPCKACCPHHNREGRVEATLPEPIPGTFISANPVFWGKVSLPIKQGQQEGATEVFLLPRQKASKVGTMCTTCSGERGSLSALACLYATGSGGEGEPAPPSIGHSEVKSACILKII